MKPNWQYLLLAFAMVKSLGIQLVVQLTRQLRGSLTFGAGAQGTVFRLAFPLVDQDD